MGISPKITKEIVKRVQRATNPDRIILFGSAANGTMTPDSDIDLLILKENPKNPLKESVLIREELRGLGFPFDVILMSTSQFEVSKDVVGGLAYPANKFGKVLYEKS
jgi:predicted nucleotidyltransferase